MSVGDMKEISLLFTQFCYESKIPLKHFIEKKKKDLGFVPKHCQVFCEAKITLLRKILKLYDWKLKGKICMT